jgi:hypothetical protein
MQPQVFTAGADDDPVGTVEELTREASTRDGDPEVLNPITHSPNDSRSVLRSYNVGPVACSASTNPTLRKPRSPERFPLAKLDRIAGCSYIAASRTGREGVAPTSSFL